MPLGGRQPDGTPASAGDAEVARSDTVAYPDKDSRMKARLEGLQVGRPCH